MDILVLGAGMMGRAIAFDLMNYSNFNKITIADMVKNNLNSTRKFLKNDNIKFEILNINNKKSLKKQFFNNDVVISAVPYDYNFKLTQLAINTNTHFLDLGGNNKVVDLQRSLFKKARDNLVTIIPDCGLAPGLTSVLTHNIVDNFDTVDYIKIRVGGLPIDPKPPLNYQIVFSPNGLFNEYLEDAIVLDNEKIIKKKSMTEIEDIIFPKPFGKMEAFITSGGCSTMPYTFKQKINHLDYKTIRYPGHCKKFKELLNIGKENELSREQMISKLYDIVPIGKKDVVLIRIISYGIKNDKKINLIYEIIDYFDEQNNITSMMRATGYPVSIIAQMIEKRIIYDFGVFGNEEIIPPNIFIKELEKRNINLKIIEKYE